MCEATGRKQQGRSHPDQPRPVAVDSRAQGQTREQAADGADAHNPSKMELSSPQAGYEIGVAEQYSIANHYEQIGHIGKPKRGPIAAHARRFDGIRLDSRGIESGSFVIVTVRF